jgi:hypothetical protein
MSAHDGDTIGGHRQLVGKGDGPISGVGPEPNSDENKDQRQKEGK